MRRTTKESLVTVHPEDGPLAPDEQFDETIAQVWLTRAESEQYRRDAFKVRVQLGLVEKFPKADRYQVLAYAWHPKMRVVVADWYQGTDAPAN